MRIFDPKTRALLTAGLVRPVDGFFVAILVVGALTMLYWRIFGSPTAQQMIVVLLATVAFFQLWVLLVLLRVGVMLLQVRADVNLMPEAAARIAAQIRLGGAPSATKP